MAINFNQLAGAEVVSKTEKMLKEKGYLLEVVATGKDALARIKELIPSGASVMNGASATLEQIGFVDYLKSGTHGWNNLHDGILAEKDPAKQSQLRKQAALSDYYLGSVHALVETGEFVIASNTGSQLPHLVFTSPNIILVVSTKKIVPTMALAMERLMNHVVPLEEKHMREKYGVGTAANKIVIFNGENPVVKRTVKIIIVNEDLGF
jgi:hypothetical protein